MMQINDALKVATPSDAEKVDVDVQEDDLLQQILDALTGPDVKGVSDDVESSEDSAAVFSSIDISPFSVIQQEDFVNVGRFDVRFRNVDYTFLVPVEYEPFLFVDSSNFLWNVGSETISGRLYSGDFAPAADDGMILYLSPCNGNNFSVNHNYGSPNYVRDYSWSGGSYDRLTYDTYYGNVEVLEYVPGSSTARIPDMIQIFLLGVVALLLLFSWFRRY